MNSIYEQNIPVDIRCRAEKMALHYMRGVRKERKVDGKTLEWWAVRYYEAMVRVLQKQCKR